MQRLDNIDNLQRRKKPLSFKVGDLVRVHVKVQEAGRERIQVFQGTVIGRKGSGARETFTVRKVSFGVGVERTFPVHSPRVSKVEIKSRGHTRRAKLYYLREKVGKKARLREKAGVVIAKQIAESETSEVEERSEEEASLEKDEESKEPDTQTKREKPEPQEEQGEEEPEAKEVASEDSKTQV